MKLYHAARSRSCRVRWLLEELGLAYELIELELTKEALGAPGYRAISPLGKVPTFIDGDITLHESIAIIEWVLDRYGDGRLRPAAGSAAEAAMLEFLHYGESTLILPVVITVGQFRRPREQRSKALIEQMKADYHDYLRLAELALASGHDYLAGEFSAADISVGYAMALADVFRMNAGISDTMAEYFQRLGQRPAYQKAFG
jgi:glutathione S-transferase